MYVCYARGVRHRHESQHDKMHFCSTAIGCCAHEKIKKKREREKKRHKCQSRSGQHADQCFIFYEGSLLTPRLAGKVYRQTRKSSFSSIQFSHSSRLGDARKLARRENAEGDFHLFYNSNEAIVLGRFLVPNDTYSMRKRKIPLCTG